MPRADFGHLYKFIVSTGMLLIAVGLVLPWFVLQASGTLLVDQAKLDSATNSARHTLEIRQEQVGFAVAFFPYVSAGLVVIGVVCVVYGYLKWRERQLVLDDIEDISRDTNRFNFDVISAAEADNRLDAEAAEAGADARAGTNADSDGEAEEARGETPNPAASDETSPAVTPSNEIPTDSRPEGPDALTRPSGSNTGVVGGELAANPSHSAVRTTIARAEELGSYLVARALSRTHTITRNVRLVRGEEGPRAIVDLLAEAKYGANDSFVVDFAFVSSRQSLLARLQDRPMRLSQAAQIAEHFRGMSVAPVCVFLSAEPIGAGDVARAQDAWSWTNKTLRAPVAGIVMTFSQLESMKADIFRDLLGTALRSRNLVIADAGLPGGER